MNSNLDSPSNRNKITGYGSKEFKNSADANTFEIFISRYNNIRQKNQLPNYELTKFSEKSHGLIRGFAVCTNQGLVRNYNEDRVSIVLNILRPQNKPLSEYWPNCSFFAIYDGHGGNKCAEFLRSNLHQYVNSIKLLESFMS